ncbi:autotransporter secretion inner membrane protein TamB [Blastomonas natatoria]|uniref:Autotransporter secretion inner membrane protein TamB n=1 Tax=Blastomonas natatoria TaxID=34015 RepID=A0A2V3VCK4_9SPHN|nr:translocation/assembly module TamB domain-containing protein [Blastomonas natatoria]PXW78498.1 autotransporter secretion inner membrane protein TamB [Blastomonas natatoria]
MVDEPISAPADQAAPDRAPIRWLRGVMIGVLVMAGLVAALLFGLDTGPGRRFVAEQIAGYQLKSGLSLRVARIDGSIYGKAVLRGVEIRDTRRVFFAASAIDLDWRPFTFLNNRLDIRDLNIRRGELRSLPELNPGDPDDPLLPAFDIRIDRLRADGLVIRQGVAGPRRVANLSARADIRSGRVLVEARASLADGTDRLAVKIDARPDQNRLMVDGDVVAPADGAIAALAGLTRDLAASIKGRGDWGFWRGKLLARLGNRELTSLDLTQREGQVRVRGFVRPEPLIGNSFTRALGPAVGVVASGTLDARVLSGTIALAGQAGSVNAEGAIDLGENRFDNLELLAALSRPGLLAEGLDARNVRATLTLDGPFGDLTAPYRLSADRVALAGVSADALLVQGTIRRQDKDFTIPVKLSATRVATGNAYGDRLADGLRGEGVVRMRDGALSSDPIRMVSNSLVALVQLSGSTQRGRYLAVADVRLPAFGVENVGNADIDANVRLAFGGGAAWDALGDVRVLMRRVVNQTVVNLVGLSPRFAGRFSYAAGQPFVLRDASLAAQKLALIGGGRIEPDGRIVLRASGRHRDYGPLDVGADSIRGDTRAVLTLEDPLPALGVRDLRLALGTVPDGFSVDVAGQSTLGPIEGVTRIYAREAGRTLIEVERFAVSQALFAGDIYAASAGVEGALTVAGGGITGNVTLEPRGEAQGIKAMLNLADARFDGDVPITINRGAAEIDALIAEGRNTIIGSVRAQGIGRGPVFIGRLAANANLVNGEGRVTASLAGRRGSNFDLQTSALIASNAVTLSGNGTYGNRRLRLVRPARLSKLDDGGWRLAPAVLRVGRGRLGAQGRFGGGLTDMTAQFNTVPLALFDVAVRELGFGGNASGTLSYRQAEGGVPTGKASLKFDNLTRTGLIVSSKPVDIAANLVLSNDALAMRAVIGEQDKTVGRAQARIGNLPQGFDLFGRLRRGTLAGQLRFNGPADSLWRLLGIEAFDVTGQVGVAADLSGSLVDPSIQGILATRTARLESTLSGTVISDIAARGRFNGSRLTLTSFSGKAGSNGTVSGSGYVDYGGLFASPSRGVSVEIKASARNAQLVNRDDFGATVTGPLTISSDGSSGTLGGDVVLNRGRFRLGQFNAEEALPVINVREINRRADEAPRRSRPAIWRYDVKARAPNQFTVTGLGINSEWGANVTLTGTVDAPRITGQADLIRGEYEFAGRDFELVRGRINFRGESPPNPALDIAASANLTDLNATINVRGTGLAPEISFTSTPALPEDELLARLLFGSSITDISAPEAVQLAAALASLRGGGGLDPINALRGAIGLDRLRIVEGNQTLGQGTSIAAGKYITRNTYVEIVTDGRGYSATQVEFQITRWLSLLSSISTIGRQSANVRISKDY